ncbi:hypothetical protein [Streptomyces sp. NPDC048172]|uniref:hypothetical protein n=1 Tax=Streptomyces sp. NPDC048172 TaxID=3365505 RepID=UPI00371E97C1
MEQHVNIVLVVDVIGALSDGTLRNGNLIMIDDSPYESAGQGTPDLQTYCKPGQTINWTILALDLQTPADIKNITFLGAESSNGGRSSNGSGAQPTESKNLHLEVWSGVVPAYLTPGESHRYRLEIQMYDGEASVIHVDTPALTCV